MVNIGGGADALLPGYTVRANWLARKGCALNRMFAALARKVFTNMRSCVVRVAMRRKAVRIM